jgi:hypothetical protein
MQVLVTGLDVGMNTILCTLLIVRILGYLLHLSYSNVWCTLYWCKAFVLVTYSLVRLGIQKIKQIGHIIRLTL